jgi:predicted dehydrogenase
MSNRKINVAIVGLGFGKEFIPIYQLHPDVGNVAICMRRRDVLNEIGITSTFKLI